MGRSASDLVEAARAGDRAALARLLSMVERGGDGAREVGAVTHPLGGAAYTVGITGAPGAGKSTLTAALLRVARSAGERVAVLAIDPSSPFTGGAILGDRIRMQDHATDDGVVIRSMATRGHLGGLALATPGAVRVLDAAGWPWVVVETVGVGQVEVDVAGAADTTVVVLNPGWGDAVQASKAGLLEIADVFVVNKADRPGADEARADLERVLDLSTPARRPEVVSTVAETGDGVADLWDAIGRHRHDLERTDLLEQRRAERIRDELARLVTERVLERARHAATGDRFEEQVAAVRDRRVDPWTAADELLAGGEAR
jgi:LAO/AO transport system kinase